MKLHFCLPIVAGLLSLLITHSTAAQETKHGTVVTEHLASTVLQGTITGLNSNRTIKIYLPPGYAASSKAYPVVYYFHSINWSADKLFEDGNLVNLLERGFAHEVAKEFIFVAADYSTPTLGCWYENSPATGRWLDFTVKERVPFIDAHFRTLPQRESRGVAGDFVGGRGALISAMLYPDIFSVVYALHPVATGTGSLPMTARTNWQKIHDAKTLVDLDNEPFARPFVSICQAFLPNPSRPPFFCDFMVERENGQLKVNLENTKKLKKGFLLDQMLDEYATNLRTLRGIAFDWARYDSNQDHVYSNQSFTRKLDDLGVEQEAEEYNGDPWNKNWTENGRFYTRLLPFFNRHLVFEKSD
jgi:hypothetical protein